MEEACLLYDFEALNSLISKGKAKEISFFACINRLEIIIDFMLTKATDLTGTDLLYALVYGNHKDLVIKYALTNKSWGPYFCCMAGNLELLKWWPERIHNLNFALSQACEKKHENIIEYLLEEQKAIPNCQLLEYCFETNNTKYAELCFKSGLQMTVKDLEIGCENGSYEIIKQNLPPILFPLQEINIAVSKAFYRQHWATLKLFTSMPNLRIQCSFAEHYELVLIALYDKF